MFSDLIQLLNILSQAFLYFDLLLILHVMACKQNTNNFIQMLYNKTIFSLNPPTSLFRNQIKKLTSLNN